MDISGLWTLQCMMFLLVAAGALLKKKGILKEEGKSVLTDAVLYFFLPCNIINSFRMEFDISILRKFAVILIVSVPVSYTHLDVYKRQGQPGKEPYGMFPAFRKLCAGPGGYRVFLSAAAPPLGAVRHI